jgi:undecaprenyl-diphosphatase
MPKGYSFPSGHTLSAFLGATVLCCYKRSWGIPALILAGLIAFSRLYLYVHFPSDVLAGLVLGVVIGLVTVFLYGKIMRKDKKQPDTN